MATQRISIRIRNIAFQFSRYQAAKWLLRNSEIHSRLLREMICQKIKYKSINYGGIYSFTEQEEGTPVLLFENWQCVHSGTTPYYQSDNHVPTLQLSSWKLYIRRQRGCERAPVLRFYIYGLFINSPASSRSSAVLRLESWIDKHGIALRRAGSAF